MSRKKNRNRVTSMKTQQKIEQNSGKNNDEAFNIISLPRVCNVGDTNKNGLKYSKESYINALIKFKEKYNNNQIPAEVFFISNGNNPYIIPRNKTNIKDINTKNIGAIIEDIGDENVLFKIYDYDLYEMITNKIKSGKNIKVYMRYMADKEVKLSTVDITEIIAFDILIEDDEISVSSYEEYKS